MSDLHRLLEESVGVVHAVRAEQSEQRREIGALELAVAGLAAAVGELAAAGRADREVLQRILEACTREGGGELHEAMEHMAALIKALGADGRAILAAVAPRPPPPPG